jgi:hypothetical protein
VQLFCHCAFAACVLLLQAFHTLFHTDESVLLGAPTGSGKTISSELTMMRLWEAHPGDKVRAAAAAACHSVGLGSLYVTALLKSRSTPMCCKAAPCAKQTVPPPCE